MSKQPPFLVLNVKGVGYELEAPLSAFYDFPAVQEQASVFVHLVVREDAQLLFAFANQNQRDLFRSLIKVNGVGPKVALAMLSTLSASELVQCIANKDVTQLCRVPGIGKKTAQRLVVEMQDRLTQEMGELSNDSEAGSNNYRADAIAALVSLGYKQNDASAVIGRLASDLTSEDLIRQALKTLSGKVL